MCSRDVQIDFPNAPFLRTSADRTLSAGTRIYALPSDFEKMNTVTYPTGDVELRYLPQNQFDMVQPSASETGTPLVYTIRGAEENALIEFYPAIGSGITVHFDYQKLLDVVSAGSATPPLPAKYRELYVLYGEILGLRRRGGMMSRRGPEWMFVQQQYDALKEKMREDLLRQTTTPTVIRSVREMQRATQSSDPILNAFYE